MILLIKKVFLLMEKMTWRCAGEKPFHPLLFLSESDDFRLSQAAGCYKKFTHAYTQVLRSKCFAPNEDFFFGRADIVLIFVV